MLTGMDEQSSPLDTTSERALAISLSGRVNELLTSPPSPGRDAALVHAAHASCHHWRAVGTLGEQLQAERVVARVYSELGRAEPALYHARRCLDLVRSGDDAFDQGDDAAALEAVARAELVTGDLDAAAERARQARAALSQVVDAAVRARVERDLDALGLG
jgi:hypothetical protein